MICYFVRHGKDDESVRGGWSQSSLTVEGFAQAEKLAQHIHGQNWEIRNVFSSDLPRAMQTAYPVAAQLHLPIIPMPDFREANNGDLSGMKNEMATQLYPGLFWNTLAWDQKYPGGESPQEFYERIYKAWDSFQRKVIERDENVLLITHGGVINVILSIVNGEVYSNKMQPRKIRNTEILALRFQNGVWEELKSE